MLAVLVIKLLAHAMFEMVAAGVLQEDAWTFVNEALELLTEVWLLHRQVSVKPANIGLTEAFLTLLRVKEPAKEKDAIGVAQRGEVGHGSDELFQVHRVRVTPCPRLRHPHRGD